MLLIWAILNLGLAHSQARVPNEPGIEVGSRTIHLDVKKKFIAYYSFVGNSNHPEKRGMNDLVVDKGWPAYIKRRVDPVMATGWTRLWLHNPFGRSGTEVMEFCQYLEALRHKPKKMAAHMTDHFVDHWKNIIDRGIEVTMYLGGPHQDDEMVPLEGHEQKWWDHAMACMDPLLEAGVTSLGLDNSAPQPPHSPTHQLASWWKSNRGPVIVEARPKVGTDWTDGYKILAVASTWDMQSPEIHAKQKGRHIYEWEATGEVIELVHVRNEDFKNWTLTRQALRDGHSVLISANHIQHRTGANIKNLDHFIRVLNVDAAYRIDLSSGPPQAHSGVTFEILDGPHFGRLEPMQYDPTGSVFLYTPSLYFSGTDEISFAVHEGQNERREKIIIHVSGMKGKR